MSNTFETSLTNQDKKLGFELKTIKNPSEDYFLSPECIEAVVLELSSVERIIKIVDPTEEYSYLHQWCNEDEWLPCCNHPVETGLDYFKIFCSQFNEYEKILKKHDRDTIYDMIHKDTVGNKLEIAKTNIRKRSNNSEV